MPGGMPYVPGLSAYYGARRQSMEEDAAGLQKLMGALSIAGQQEDRAFAREQRPLQLEALKAQVAEQNRMNGILTQYQGAQGGALSSPTPESLSAATSGDLPMPAGPTNERAALLTPQAQPGGAGGMGLPPRVELALLHPKLAALGKEQAKFFEPRAVSEGGGVFVPGRGFIGVRPKVGEGLQPTGYGPTGELEGVQAIPGYANARAAIIGAEEGARARLDPFMGELDAQSRPIPQTRAEFAARRGAPPVTPPGPLPSGPATAPVGNLGTETAARGAIGNLTPEAPTPGDVASIDRELARRDTTPQQRAVLMEERSRIVMGGQQPQAAAPRGMGLSPEQRAGAETGAKNDAELANTYRQKIPTLSGTLRRLDRLEALNKDDATFAASGAEMKTQLGSIAQGFGLNVNQAKTANSEEYLAHIAELLKDRLASKDYGSGTGVSNIDLLAARTPLPDLMRTQLGRQQILQAVRSDTQRSLQDATAARTYFEQNLSLRGFRYPSEQNNPILDQQQTGAAIRDFRNVGATGPRPAGRGVVNFGDLR